METIPAKVSVRWIPPCDWAEAWKRHFRPMEIGRALLIRPSWSRRKPCRGQSMVVLDPGLSFGTGRHPTTSFCLEQLVACRRLGQSQSFLDIGTGSGILAIAASKLGYLPVDAFDLDSTAVRVAKANAAANGVKGRVHIFRQDLTRMSLCGGSKYDMICANLTHDLLQGESRRVVSRLQSSGTLVLAGLLENQFSKVRSAFAAGGWKLVANHLEQGWRSGVFHMR